MDNLYHLSETTNTCCHFHVGVCSPPHPTPLPPPRECQALGVLVGFPVGHELSGKKCLLFPQGKKTTFTPRFKYVIIQFSCSLITFEVEHFSAIFVENREQERKLSLS